MKFSDCNKFIELCKHSHNLAFLFVSLQDNPGGQFGEIYYYFVFRTVLLLQPYPEKNGLSTSILGESNKGRGLQVLTLSIQYIAIHLITQFDTIPLYLTVCGIPNPEILSLTTVESKRQVFSYRRGGQSPSVIEQRDLQI